MIPLPLRARPRNRLELVNAGGPTTGTFDPTVGVSRSRPATMLFGDGSSESKTGTSLDFSHTYPADGVWRARLRGVPLREITSIYAKDDLVTEIRRLRRCVRLSSLEVYTNPSLRASLRDVPAGVTTLHAFSCPLISPVGIHLLTSISDIRIYSNGYSSAIVDAVLEEMYTHRMSFTAAAPFLHIGGTNAAPSGTYQNADPPTTGLEYVYKLVNDPDGDGHRKWAISWTGGSAP